MDSIIFNNGTIVQASDLNDAQTRKADAIKNRFIDTRSYGVIEDKSPEQIVYTDGTSLGIYGVVAYTKDGERIYIAPNDNPEIPAIYGLLPDSNGMLIKGGEKLVPQKNYTLVIRYKEQKNAPILHHVVSGKPFFTHNDATYELYLRNFNMISYDDIVLATITCASDGSVSVDESTRKVSTIPPTAIIGSVSNGTSTYGTNVSYEEHINSVGTGSVTKYNPHGLSASDLGIDVGALADHQKLLHVDGIRTDDIATTTSAMYPYYRKETLTNEEVVYVQPLSASLNEMAVIAGESVVPSQFASVFSYSMKDKASSDYVGYYLCSYDSTQHQVVVNGPYESETNTTFLQLLNTKYLFPICSFQWKYVDYDVTGDLVADVGSYNIVPATFKDLRVFNNTSLENFRPNQAFALTQFAPVANDVAYLHNARITSALDAPVFNVAGRTLSLTVNNKDEFNITFQGTNPISATNVLEQLINAFVKLDDNNNAYLAAYPRINEENHLTLSAPLSIKIKPAQSNDASAFLGFSVAQKNMEAENDNLIKEMIYYGDRNGIILFKYNDDDDVTEITYYLGGGYKLKNIFNYNGGFITHVNEVVERI